MVAVHFSIFLICALLGGLLSLLIFVGDGAGMLLFLWLYPQMLIVAVLIMYIMLFASLEIICKNKSISESLTNARINLFFSKNNIILKMVGGNILISVFSSFILLAVMLISAIIVIIPMVLGLNIVAYILYGIVVIVFLVVYMLIYFIIIIYMYLVYMLNEIRDDKVENLK